MRAADPRMHYLVGTPKGRLTRLEKHLVAKPWQEARPGVQVKLLAQEGELYVLAQSRDLGKERAIRRRQLKRLWARLKQLSTMQLTREELLMKLGAARDQSRMAWRLAVIEVAADTATFSYRLDRDKLRHARSREGRYLLRTNLVEEDPAKLWSHYLSLVAVEEAFKNLKGDLAIRPIFHQLEARVEAHVFIAFLALPTHHAGAALARAGAGADATQRAGEVCRHADDRRAPADHRRPRAGVQPLHRARTRAQPVTEHTQTGATRPTTPKITAAPAPPSPL
jgi:hypothetical protein